MTCHEAIDLMVDAIDGRLTPTLQPGFDEHMAECAPCATYLDHLRATRSALRHLPLEGGTSPHRQRLIDAYREEFERDSD